MEHDHSPELVGVALRERLMRFGQRGILTARLEQARATTDHRLAIEIDGVTVEVEVGVL